MKRVFFVSLFLLFTAICFGKGFNVTIKAVTSFDSQINEWTEWVDMTDGENFTFNFDTKTVLYTSGGEDPVFTEFKLISYTEPKLNKDREKCSFYEAQASDGTKITFELVENEKKETYLFMNQADCFKVAKYTTF